MRILILANSDIGLYKFRKELLEKFIAEQHEVYISLPKGDFSQDIKEIGCQIRETKISRHGKNPIQDLCLLKKYREIIREIDADIILTYTIKPNIYGGIAAILEDKPYVVNITGLGSAVEKKRIMQVLTLFLYRLALKKVQTVFFQNLENELFFTKHHLAVKKHKQLPGSGVNLDYYKVQEYPSDKTLNFVFIARIMKEKGIEQYLGAAKVIRKKYPHTRFHICGFCEEEYESQIKKFQEQEVVIYHGLVKDMRSIYGWAHCVIHPTYYPEGLSNVLLEAAASARPIITTNRSGCREVIDNGVNGYVIPEKNLQALIYAIEKFLFLSNEERKRMGLAGRKKVEVQFDREIVIKSYMEELKIMEQNRNGL